MQYKSLTEIAGEMWRIAEENGTARTTLTRGLTIVVKVEGRRRFMGLHRGNDGVPWEEAVICAAAFEVPKGVRGAELETGAARWSVYSWEGPAAEQLSLLEEGL